MKRITIIFICFVIILTVSLATVGCGGGQDDKGGTDETSAESWQFECENDPHVQKTGGKLYYIGDDGERVTGVYALYNHNAYYFNKGDQTGVEVALKWITENILSCEIVHGCMYIVHGDDSALVIDTGFGIGNVRELVELILGDMPYEVALTHMDPDHAGGVCSFEGVTKVWTTAEDAEDRENSWTVERRAADIVNSGNPFSIDDIYPVSDTFEFDIFDDGKVFDLGNYEIETLKIPGHSRGFTMFLFKRDRILLVGDAGTKKSIIPNTIETYYNRLKEINARNAEWDFILTSHDSGALLDKTGIDNLISVCEKIFEVNPANGADEFASESVNGWGIQYKADNIYEEK